MKIKSLSTALCTLLSVLSLSLPAFAAGETGRLVVQIAGLRNDAGVVRVALFNNEGDYKADKDNVGDHAFKKDAVSIKDKQAVCTFSDVPYGDYVVKFFHDEDNSGKFVTGTFGIPKVEYGFSNNVKGLMGPPSYDKARLSFHQSELILHLNSLNK